MSNELKPMILVGTHCQHCGPMLMSLSEMVKEGRLPSLEVVNVEQQPDIAEELGVRSVPWFRVGWFELEGLRSKKELGLWVQRASAGEAGVKDYYTELLAHGRVKQCIAFIEQHPETMGAVLKLLSENDSKINVKLGIGVIMETFANTEMFETYIPELVGLLESEDPRLRLDVCHYVSLTEKQELVESLRPLLDDEDEEVRSEANDAIKALSHSG